VGSQEEELKKVYRTWIKAKEEFESACKRFKQDWHDLITYENRPQTTAGVPAASKGEVEHNDYTRADVHLCMGLNELFLNDIISWAVHKRTRENLFEIQKLLNSHPDTTGNTSTG